MGKGNPVWKESLKRARASSLLSSSRSFFLSENRVKQEEKVRGKSEVVPSIPTSGAGPRFPRQDLSIGGGI